MPFGEKERVIGAITIRFGKLSFSDTNGRNSVSIELVTCVISLRRGLSAVLCVSSNCAGGRMLADTLVSSGRPTRRRYQHDAHIRPHGRPTKPLSSERAASR